ncbi:MAG: YicC/YloC family endoribonuclease [Vicingaceae bacterium]
MIHSMTGFGNAEISLKGKRIQVSVKSVNGKSVDLNLRLPHQYKEKENDVRSLALERMKRGKIDLSVNFEHSEEERTMRINEEVLKGYLDQMKQITGGMGDFKDNDLLSIVSRFPNIVSAEKFTSDDSEWEEILKGIEQAIQHLLDFRQGEGAKLEADLRVRISVIEKLQEEINALEGDRMDNVRQKLMTQLEQLSLKNGPDMDRFEQELIYYLERFDITEENVRLRAHLQLFLETLNEGDSQGKKLSFIGQEIGREINTIGSKANHAGIQKIVVGMKDELEKIKEQLFNIL